MIDKETELYFLKNTKDFYVECAACKDKLKNWVGSTPCCGSLAYLIDEDGETSKKVDLYTSVGVVMLDFGEK